MLTKDKQLTYFTIRINGKIYKRPKYKNYFNIKV